MPQLRLFAQVREAAGTGQDELPGATVAEVLDAARQRYGAPFSELLGTCKVWVNGSPAAADASVNDSDEVALLPPVSGGT